jgi:antitoxin PrlF
MPVSTVTRKGQTTLPKEVRDALRIKPGDRIVYELEGDSVRIRSALAVIDSLYGAFHRPGWPPQDLDAARERFQQEVAEHVARK